MHLGHAPIDQAFVELEVGNAVTQQSADAAVLLEHRHVMADARELLRGSQAGGTGTDHGNFLAGFFLRRLRHHPAVLAALVDDRMLDGLDAHRVVVDVQRAGSFTWRGADASGELGKVVGRVQHIQRFAPVTAIHQIVPVRNNVIDWAARHAERNAAIHAARALRLGLFVVQMLYKLLVILAPLGHW